MKDKRLGGDTMAPSGLYARLCHAFLVVIMLSLYFSGNVHLWYSVNGPLWVMCIVWTMSIHSPPVWVC